jgi:hypothetical protein
MVRTRSNKDHLALSCAIVALFQTKNYFKYPEVDNAAADKVAILKYKDPRYIIASFSEI